MRIVVVSNFKRSLNPFPEIINSYKIIYSEFVDSFVEIKNIIYPIIKIIKLMIISLVLMPIILLDGIRLMCKRYTHSRLVKKFGIWEYINKVVNKEIKL